MTTPLQLVQLDPAETRAILAREWGWLLAERAPGRSFRPVALTAFGDWFLEEKATRAVWFLDAGLGLLHGAAQSRSALQVALGDPRRRQAWCLEGQLRQLQARGVRLGPGECYSWLVPPCAGGRLEADNVAALPFELHQRLQSRLVRRLRLLPEGAPLSPRMISEIFEGLDGRAPARRGLPLGRIAAGLALGATLLGLVDALPDPDSHPVDGRNLAPLFTGRADPSRPEQFLMHYPHAPHRSNYFTVWRDGDWKAIHHALPEIPTHGNLIQHSGGHWQLFNLKDDPFEQKDLASTEPETLKRLAAGMRSELERMKAVYPVDAAGKPIVPEVP